jgi:hypothetical protein
VTFHEVLILQAALDPFLTALFLYLIAVGLTSGSFSSKVWVAAGAAGGLLALNRPNALLCVVAVALALAVAKISLRTFVPAVAFVVGTAIVVALPLARNLIVSGEPVLISSHGGLNFLVGNGPGANGVYRAIPGITPDIGGQTADTKRVAEA